MKTRIIAIALTLALLTGCASQQNNEKSQQQTQTSHPALSEEEYDNMCNPETGTDPGSPKCTLVGYDENEPTPELPSVGDTQAYEDYDGTEKYDITLNKIETKDVIKDGGDNPNWDGGDNQYIDAQAPEGKTFLIAYFTMKNTGSTQQMPESLEPSVIIGYETHAQLGDESFISYNLNTQNGTPSSINPGDTAEIITVVSIPESANPDFIMLKDPYIESLNAVMFSLA